MANEYGFVYVLGNQVMDQVYKIGYTDRSPNQRCDELSASTSCPHPFDVICYAELRNPRMIEQHLHKCFAKQRISAGREFFKLDQSELQELISALAFFDESISKAEGRGFPKYVIGKSFADVCLVDPFPQEIGGDQ